MWNLLFLCSLTDTHCVFSWCRWKCLWKFFVGQTSLMTEVHFWHSSHWITRTGSDDTLTLYTHAHRCNSAFCSKRTACTHRQALHALDLRFIQYALRNFSISGTVELDWGKTFVNTRKQRRISADISTSSLDVHTRTLPFTWRARLETRDAALASYC